MNNLTKLTGRLLILLSAIFLCFTFGAYAEDILLENRTRIAQLEKEFEDFIRSNKDIQNELMDLQNKLTAELTKLAEKVQKLEDQNESLKSEIENISSLYTREIELLKEKINELEKDKTASVIEVDKPGWMIWNDLVSDNMLQNFTARVEMRKERGGTGYYGLLFKKIDANNFYQYWISTDGYYGLMVKYGIGTQEAEWKTLIEATSSPLINKGYDWNTMEVVVEGEKIELYLNGEFLNSREDSTIESGGISVVAETPQDQSSLKVLYNNFDSQIKE